MKNLKNVKQFINESLLLKEKISDALNSPHRFEGIDIGSLNYMLSEIDKVLVQLENESLAPKESRYMVLTRIILDSWPLGSEIGNDISEWEKKYCGL